MLKTCTALLSAPSSLYFHAKDDDSTLWQAIRTRIFTLACRPLKLLRTGLKNRTNDKLKYSNLENFRKLFYPQILMFT